MNIIISATKFSEIISLSKIENISFEPYGNGLGVIVDFHLFDKTKITYQLDEIKAIVIA